MPALEAYPVRPADGAVIWLPGGVAARERDAGRRVRGVVWAGLACYPGRVVGNATANELAFNRVPLRLACVSLATTQLLNFSVIASEYGLAGAPLHALLLVLTFPWLLWMAFGQRGSRWRESAFSPARVLLRRVVLLALGMLVLFSVLSLLPRYHWLDFWEFSKGKVALLFGGVGGLLLLYTAATGDTIERIPEGQ